MHNEIGLKMYLQMTQKEKDEARKEVSVLAKMNHPNIVSYQDSFEEKGQFWFNILYWV